MVLSMAVERREYMRSVSHSSKVFSWGTLFKLWHRKVKDISRFSEQMKQRSGFRDMEAAAICGLGYWRRGDCTEKEPKNLEKSAIKPLVKYEASRTPKSWQKIATVGLCEMNGNGRNCQMIENIGI